LLLLGVDAERVQRISIVVLSAARAANSRRGIRQGQAGTHAGDDPVWGGHYHRRPDDRRIPLVVLDALTSHTGGGVAMMLDLKAIPKMGGEQVFEIVRSLLAVEAARLRRFEESLFRIGASAAPSGWR
jgi:hypothetical protein